MIFHICSRTAWETAAREGRYDGSDLDRRDGFIHFSAADRVRQTAALHLRGIDGLVLIGVEPDALGASLRWEESRDGVRFPHLYAPLAVTKDVKDWDLPVGRDGFHVFPPFIPL